MSSVPSAGSTVLDRIRSDLASAQRNVGGSVIEAMQEQDKSRRKAMKAVADFGLVTQMTKTLDMIAPAARLSVPREPVVNRIFANSIGLSALGGKGGPLDLIAQSAGSGVLGRRGGPVDLMARSAGLISPTQAPAARLAMEAVMGASPGGVIDRIVNPYGQPGIRAMLGSVYGVEGSPWDRFRLGYDPTAYRNALDTMIGTRAARIARDVVAWTDSPEFEPSAAAAALPVEEDRDAVVAALTWVLEHRRGLSKAQRGALIMVLYAVWQFVDNMTTLTAGGIAAAGYVYKLAPKADQD